jgi:hypothetical protein
MKMKIISGDTFSALSGRLLIIDSTNISSLLEKNPNIKRLFLWNEAPFVPSEEPPEQIP